MYYKDIYTGKMFEFKQKLDGLLVVLNDGYRSFIDVNDRYEDLRQELEEEHQTTQTNYKDAVKTNKPIWQRYSDSQ